MWRVIHSYSVFHHNFHHSHYHITTTPILASPPQPSPHTHSSCHVTTTPILPSLSQFSVHPHNATLNNLIPAHLTFTTPRFLYRSGGDSGGSNYRGEVATHCCVSDVLEERWLDYFVIHYAFLPSRA